MGPALSAAPRLKSTVDRHARIRSMVDDNTHFVARTLQKAGVPLADLDDEIQRTFIVAARRIDDVVHGSERQFLTQVAVNLASHVRRKLARRREVLNDQVPERIETIATPEKLTDRKQMRTLLDGIVGSMAESLRTVFTLYEFEEMKVAEIAQLLDIPRGTVASRLRRAREHLRQHVVAIELAWDIWPVDRTMTDERVSMLLESASALERALLRTGVSLSGSKSARAKTLAVLGLLSSPSQPG
jgi:RNA polymerase sigma-70 factor (ECF subfamily)